ncbi:hypothetical protein POG22_08500 [Geitlerinema sp. CS-897]|nr:hypothetical protein [Geitlerinema sp. CS-897]
MQLRTRWSVFVTNRPTRAKLRRLLLILHHNLPRLLRGMGNGEWGTGTGNGERESSPDRLIS